MLEGSRILIIGANGYIGSHLALYLKKKCRRLLAADRQEAPLVEGVEYIQLDMLEPDAPGDLIAEFDFVFFMVGKTGTVAGFDQYREYVDLNQIALLNLLNVIKEKNRNCKVLFPSTRLIYRGGETPLEETDPLELKTIYAVNKFACESYLNIYANCFDIKYNVFRVCVPYGNEVPGSGSYGTLSFFINRARSGQDLAVFGDGRQRRSLIHVADLVRLMVKAALNRDLDDQVFNIGGNDARSIAEIVERIAEKFNVKYGLAPWPELDRKIESGTTVFDSRKIHEFIDYEYRYTFEDWLGQLPV